MSRITIDVEARAREMIRQLESVPYESWKDWHSWARQTCAWLLNEAVWPDLHIGPEPPRTPVLVAEVEYMSSKGCKIPAYPGESVLVCGEHPHKWVITLPPDEEWKGKKDGKTEN